MRSEAVQVMVSEDPAVDAVDEIADLTDRRRLLLAVLVGRDVGPVVADAVFCGGTAGSPPGEHSTSGHLI